MGPFEVNKFYAEKKVVYVSETIVYPDIPFNIMKNIPYFDTERMYQYLKTELDRKFEQLDEAEKEDVILTEVFDEKYPRNFSKGDERNGEEVYPKSA